MAAGVKSAIDALWSQAGDRWPRFRNTAEIVDELKRFRSADRRAADEIVAGEHRGKVGKAGVDEAIKGRGLSLNIGRYVNAIAGFVQ